MINISKECQENIYKINLLINKAVKEIKIANARAESAEKMLEQLRTIASNEMKKAFDEGYKKGLQSISSDESGGHSKEDESKLVLKSN